MSQQERSVQPNTLTPRDAHERTVQAKITARLETTPSSQTLKETLDARRRRKESDLEVVKRWAYGESTKSKSKANYDKYSIPYFRRKAEESLADTLAQENIGPFLKAFELSDPEAIRQYTPHSFYIDTYAPDVKDKLRRIKPHIPNESAIPEIIDNLSRLGFAITPLVFERMNTADLISFAAFAPSANPGGFEHVIEQLNEYSFIRATEPVMHHPTFRNRLLPEQSTPEFTTWRTIAEKGQRGEPILTAEERQTLDAVSHINRLTKGKGFAQDSEYTELVYGLNDFLSLGKEWQQTSFLFDELFAANPHLFAKMTEQGNFLQTLRSLVHDRRVKPIADIIKAQFEYGVPENFTKSAESLMEVLQHDPSTLQSGLTEWTNTFINTSPSFSEREKAFWQSAFQLASPDFPELYDLFLSKKDQWFTSTDTRQLIVDAWTTAKDSQGIIINSGDAVIRFLDKVGQGSDLVKELALADIASAIELKHLTGRTDVEIASRQLPRILEKNDYLTSTNPRIRFLLNYAIQNLPFGIGQNAIEEMREKALQLETQTSNLLNARTFGENPFGWIHQATHNYLNPLNIDLFDAFIEYLKGGNNARILELLARQDTLAVDIQHTGQPILLFNPATHPHSELLHLSPEQRQQLFDTYGQQIQAIRDDMAEMYHPKLTTLLKRLDATDPYLELFPGFRQTIETALKGLGTLEKFQEAILEGSYATDINPVAIIEQVCAARELIHQQIAKGLTPEEEARMPKVKDIRASFKSQGIDTKVPISIQDYYATVVFSTLMSIDQRIDMSADLLFSSGLRYIQHEMNPQNETISNSTITNAVTLEKSMLTFLQLSGMDLPTDELFSHIIPILNSARALDGTDLALQQLGHASVLAVRGLEKTHRDINETLAINLTESGYTAAVRTLETPPNPYRPNEHLTLTDDQKSDIRRNELSETIHQRLVNVYKKTSLYPINTHINELTGLIGEVLKKRNTEGLQITADFSPTIAEATEMYEQMTHIGNRTRQQAEEILGVPITITADDFTNLNQLNQKLSVLEAHPYRRALELLRLMEGEKALSQDLAKRGIEIITVDGIDMLIMRNAAGEIVKDPFTELEMYYSQRGNAVVPAMYRFLRERGG